MTTVNVQNAKGETLAKIRKCPICGRLFGKGQRTEYRKHLRDHKTSIFIRCELCNSTIPIGLAHNLPFVTNDGQHKSKKVCTRCFGIGAKFVDDWAKRKEGSKLG